MTQVHEYTMDEWKERLKRMSEQTLAQQKGTIYRTCQSCYWWDYNNRGYREDVMVAVCKHRHVQKLFGAADITHNFGCIYHSLVPPEVTR